MLLAIAHPKASFVPGDCEFSWVYQEYFEYVFRIVGRLCGGSHVEDLTQEVFMVAYKRLPEFENRAAITTWLFRIAYRIVGAHVRGERRRRRLSELLGRKQRAVEAQSPMLVEQLQVRKILIESVDRLPWKKRSVLILHDVEEWSAQEIAAHIGIPVNTVYSRLRGARAQLAKQFTSQCALAEGGEDVQ